MEEEIDFSKWDNKCFLCLEKGLLDYKIIIYDLSMEKQGQEYVPILILHTCDVFGNCINGIRKVARKNFFPEYNPSIKEISREVFNNLKQKIHTLYTKEMKPKADKLLFYFQCEKLYDELRKEI